MIGPSKSQLDASAPPGAVAKFDGEWLDKDGNMITQPGRIGIIRHPQPGEENYALFKQLTDPQYLSRRAADVNTNAISITEKVRPGLEPHQTTHFSSSMPTAMR